ncbi:MAG: LURP-one-related family protein [Clostridia bacterium]|nr:LURP-one-related family protein [Clostridia bacterium]
MKVYIRNKMISWGGDSEVLNESQAPVFRVEGKVVTCTKKKRMYNMKGELLYTIRNRFWNGFFNKVFVYNAEGVRVATIKKNKFSFSARYHIVDTEDEMSIEGKLFSRFSTIMRNGQPVATITREFTVVNDAFTLEAEEKDIPFFTALVIAFDNLKDKRQGDRD